MLAEKKAILLLQDYFSIITKWFRVVKCGLLKKVVILSHISEHYKYHLAEISFEVQFMAMMGTCNTL